ncbi:peptide/nickel transport system permease protein [Sedimentibacter acidaminivorans]|uniref:Peptide/nickel transport system permease protein n=1 Tax=Sedimentibacter acidaminivorans TaxID=913099 RepID=A0ABS4GC23_9FIRM|nr:ABC transporter permease [Sedimentibacter acidaminivorans]MBP1925243.1 peptide/nickel transport system permease protein [Sedimentibacter acidaminivorans]
MDGIIHNNKKPTDALKIKQKYKKQSQLKEIWFRLKKNKTSVLGLIIILIIISLAIASGFIYDYDEDVINQNISERLQSPSLDHPFGTDELGRDILARIIYGSRTSLSIGFTTVVISLISGGILGAISGFYGGRIDNVIMRIMDIFLAIPGTLFAITIVAALGTSTINLMIALSISGVPRFARIVRSSVMTVKDVEFVEAARAIGANNLRIIIQHVIPNSLAPVIVQTTLQVATIILTIAGLSFLGLGVSAPQPEWGAMLSSARAYMREYSYMTLFPGLAIMITILALNLLGDGLRDALDPRLK